MAKGRAQGEFRFKPQAPRHCEYDVRTQFLSPIDPEQGLGGSLNRLITHIKNNKLLCGIVWGSADKAVTHFKYSLLYHGNL